VISEEKARLTRLGRSNPSPPICPSAKQGSWGFPLSFSPGFSRGGSVGGVGSKKVSVYSGIYGGVWGTKDRTFGGKLACGRQAFIATWLFDPSMSALPIILKQNSVSVGLFTLLRERELGLDRRETG
jgi:hypothetical protein